MQFFINLARWWYSKTHRIKTATAVDDFYKGIKNPFELRQKIKEFGFEWSGELKWLDWNKTPAESLATNKINCGDFVMLYKFLYEKENIAYTAYRLDGGPFYDPAWHYISIFYMFEQTWMQSNNEIVEIEENENILKLFLGRYTKIKQFTS